jgi:lipopolysaccharide/colanic/teichoic acid biosynthesis glycosyltransferase
MRTLAVTIGKRKHRRKSRPNRAGLAEAPEPFGYHSVKPALDVVLAAILIVLAAPVIGIAALFVRLTSRGPAFYAQVRLGLHGKPYHIYKIRTMYHDCEKQSGAQWSIPGDRRVTLVGRFLRKTHIDELPQLWNVLRGEMSLVGPRPERPEFVPQLQEAIRGYERRLCARPGITGLAQIFLPPDTDLQSVRRKLAYDLLYIARRGFWLDARILICTAASLAGVPFAIPRTLLWLPRMDNHQLLAEAAQETASLATGTV